MNRVADHFDRAASTYASATPIQRQVATRLADRIADSGLPAGARVAEFGCGTGYLAEILAPRLQPDLWIATDIAPAMAAAARASTPLVAVMDGARPALAAGFDLVCSSLTLQWLPDPEAVIAGWRALVRPGGRLAVATLVERSFTEWHAALAEAGAQAGGPRFASIGEACGWFGVDAEVEVFTLPERHASALDFLRALRASGTDAAETSALQGGTMRRAMRAFEARGASVTYEVMIAIEAV
jgi:malonyl-CoA O-methyltransferase